jgi:DNA-binding GntR family transcriptional regulator
MTGTGPPSWRAWPICRIKRQSDPARLSVADIVEIARPAALHDQVYARLRAMLVDGTIAPGAKLNERELCARLSISRTPLREAIKLLALSGMVELLPNRGAVAAKLNERDVTDTFEVLAALEGLAGELAAMRASEEQRRTIAALHEAMLAAHGRRDLDDYYRFNAEIHVALITAAGNPVLSRAYQSVNARVQSLRFRLVPDGAMWQSALDDHNRMMAALAARDGTGLKTIMTRHLQARCDQILARLGAGEIPARREAAF